MCCKKNSHSDNSLVVGLDNGRGFFSSFGVSTLYSCVCHYVYFSSSTLLFPNSGIRAVVRLGGERERDHSVDQASDVGDSHLRGRLLGNQVRVIMSHID